MFFDSDRPGAEENPAGLRLDELLAVRTRIFRGRLGPGNRFPDGERPGRGHAHSMDFDGLAPYVPGDDVRLIDWRATMRTGDTTVRRFLASSHRARVVVLDLRPDLHFGTADRVMAKTACLTAAWLVWMSQELHEPIGLMAPGVTVPVRRGRRHALRLLDQVVAAFEASASRAAAPDFQAAVAMVSRQDELCVISDLPVPPDPMEAAGRALAGAYNLSFLLVEDPIMRSPMVPGRYPVRGPDGARQVVQVRDPGGRDRATERRLMEAGWCIERALDLLPRETPR